MGYRTDKPAHSIKLKAGKLNILPQQIAPDSHLVAGIGYANLAKANKHSLPAVKERETVLLLSPRAHVINREPVLWGKPRANRARPRQRDMRTDEGTGTPAKMGQPTWWHTLDELDQAGPRDMWWRQNGVLAHCLIRTGKLFCRLQIISTKMHFGDMYEKHY